MQLFPDLIQKQDRKKSYFHVDSETKIITLL